MILFFAHLGLDGSLSCSHTVKRAEFPCPRANNRWHRESPNEQLGEEGKGPGDISSRGDAAGGCRSCRGGGCRRLR